MSFGFCKKYFPKLHAHEAAARLSLLCSVAGCRKSCEDNSIVCGALPAHGSLFCGEILILRM